MTNGPANGDTIAAIFLPFLGWLSVTLLDIRDRLSRVEVSIPQLYESRSEALRVRDEPISDLGARLARCADRRLCARSGGDLGASRVDGRRLLWT